MALIVPLPLRCRSCQTSRALIAIYSAPYAPLAASPITNLLGPSQSSSRILLHFFLFQELPLLLEVSHPVD